MRPLNLVVREPGVRVSGDRGLAAVRHRRFASRRASSARSAPRENAHPLRRASRTSPALARRRSPPPGGNSPAVLSAKSGRRGRLRARAKSSAWTITAKRRPCCTRPRRDGSVVAWMSPRTTKVFHQPRHLTRLAHVDRILRKSGRFCSKPCTPTLSFSGLRDRFARCLRAAHTSAPCDLVKRAQSFAAEPQVERRC